MGRTKSISSATFAHPRGGNRSCSLANVHPYGRIDVLAFRMAERVIDSLMPGLLNVPTDGKQPLREQLARAIEMDMRPIVPKAKFIIDALVSKGFRC
jgi:hypothetical protein